jgi:hypothetical protein
MEIGAEAAFEKQILWFTQDFNLNLIVGMHYFAYFTAQTQSIFLFFSHPAVIRVLNSQDVCHGIEKEDR